jgi:hypothetical protein
VHLEVEEVEEAEEVEAAGGPPTLCEIWRGESEMRWVLCADDVGDEEEAEEVEEAGEGREGDEWLAEVWGVCW